MEGHLGEDCESFSGALRIVDRRRATGTWMVFHRLRIPGEGETISHARFPLQIRLTCSGKSTVEVVLPDLTKSMAQALSHFESLRTVCRTPWLVFLHKDLPIRRTGDLSSARATLCFHSFALAYGTPTGRVIDMLQNSPR